MSKGLYIAAIEPNSGKLLIVLGVIELLSTRVQNLGFFRPIVHDDPKTDRHIRLIRDRYLQGLPPEQMFGVGHVEARRAVADGNDKQLQKRILVRFREMQRQCDFVVYSCGGMIHNDTLTISYAMSDMASGFATVPRPDLLAVLQEGG